MDLAVAQETGIFEAGNKPQHACLLAELQVILEADKVVGVGAQIFLAELHDGKGHLAGFRISQPDRLHRSEAKRIAATAGDLFDGKASFEVVELLPLRFFYRLSGEQRLVEA